MNPPPPRQKITVPASIIVAGEHPGTSTEEEGNKAGNRGGATSSQSTPSSRSVPEASTQAPEVQVTTTTNSNVPSSHRQEGKKCGPATSPAGGGACLPPPPPRRDSAPSAPPPSGNYKPPKWGLPEAAEASGLSLTVLKGGVEINNICLDGRTHFLLGRQQGAVDVLLEHPSISRKHAILQHGQNGNLFLFDNGSTHGCKVNKNRIPSKEFHRLNVGDVIKFGESSRLYALEGPEELRPAEYESDHLRNLRLDAGRKTLAAKLAKLKAGAAGEGKGEGDSGEYGISWGFDEDAVAEDEDEDGEGTGEDEGEVELPDYLKTEAQKRRRRDTKVGVTEDSVHKRDAKLFEKLQVKLAKVEHLLTENDRITAKEGGQGGLTEGQQAQLARNDKTISAVRLQIEEIEETIRSKNKARQRSKEGDQGSADADTGSKGKGKEDGEEDDDFYDRTAPVNKATSGPDLASKKAEVRARRFGVRDKIKSLPGAATPGRGAVMASPSVVSEGPGGERRVEESVAQSLEALTRQSETVAQDLERVRTELGELEVEETEEDALAAGGGDAVDPLDMFMTENRCKERRQAFVRLTSKRDALEEEQRRLKVMTEVARPSMPSLKTSARATAVSAVSAVSTAGAAPSENEAEQGGTGRASPTLDRGNVANPAAADAGRETKKEGGSNSGGPEQMSESDGRGIPSRGVATAEKTGDPEDVNQQDKGGLSPSDHVPSTSMSAAVEVLSRQTGPPSEAGEHPEEIEGDGGRKGWGIESIDKKTLGAKRRGTPVASSMLPPPPSKRPQRDGKTPMLPLTGEEGLGAGVLPSSQRRSTGKSTVKGPAAMPPPSSKPSSSAEGEEAMREPQGRRERTAGAATVKGVLEGGDVDWVPPKNALEKMAALNKKFGY